jgi:DnaJ like chaperone protein
MIIWGKVAGAILGFIFLGPVGIILGLVFGHVFDNGLRNILRAPRHTANVQAVFFKTVFQTMGYLAKADGVVSERDIQVVRQIMLNDFKLDKKQMLMAIGYFNEGKNPNFNIANSLNKFRVICGGYTDLRKFFLELLVKASLADKVLRDSQRGRLLFICGALGIRDSELEYQLRIYGYSSEYTRNKSYNNYSYKAPENTELTAAYNLLGVKATDNLKTIKNAYRRLMNKYHPDKLVSKGLPPEMIDVAKVKTQQIASAYALVVRSRK